MDTLCFCCLAVHSFCQCSYKKKKVLQPLLGCRVRSAPLFFPLLMCLSLGWAILYQFGVSTFNALWVVRHQAFYLPLHPCLFMWFPVLIRTPPLLSPTHSREGAQKFKQLCNEEMGTDGLDWGRVYSFGCSAPHTLLLRHTKCGGCKRLFYQMIIQQNTNYVKRFSKVTTQ